ncbi:MAG: DUF2147 domain-containing protein [Gemmatimonas sp.]
MLDPDTGKVYKVKIRLTDGGKKLVLRGPATARCASPPESPRRR